MNINDNKAELLAEDIEAFHMAMDKAGVPRTDADGKVYSMWGRACKMAKHDVSTKLWLWKNFVNGRPEYWAFDNPYPTHMNCGDPQTLGEPCGYAIFKPSRNGRPDVSEERVLAAIARAAPPQQEQAGAVLDGWQPIETAKKSGHDVLLYTRSCVRLGFWDELRGGIWSIWPGREPAFPTHWMPLPAAPKQEQGA